MVTVVRGSIVVVVRVSGVVVMMSRGCFLVVVTRYGEVLVAMW